jgi:hypothetical protein
MELHSQSTAPEQRITGILVNEKGEPVEYAGVILLSQADSTFVSGCVSEQEGVFHMENLCQGKYLLKASLIGYDDYYKPVYLQEGLFDCGRMSLKAATYLLDEVTVTATVPLVKNEKGKLTINIENSMLSDAGSIADMLSRTPGLMTDVGGSIAVLGKGSAIIYINNKEASSGELSSLQPSDISKVEIIRNPGAQYSASGRSVIIIRTKKAVSNATMLQVYDHLTVARKIGSTAGMSITQNIGRYSGMYSYSYGEYNQKQYLYQYQTIIQPDYTMNNISDFTQVFKNRSHNIFAGIDYRIYKQHYLGAQFSGNTSKNNKSEDRRQTIFKTNENGYEVRQINSYGGSKNDFYNIDLTYRINPDSINNFNIVAGYASQKHNNVNDIRETIFQGRKNSKINTNNNYNVYGLSADYQFNIAGLFISETGGKLSIIDNEGFSSHTDANSLAMESYDTNITKEQIFAGYYTVKKDIGGFSIKGGVRYEYSKSRINASGNEHDLKTSEFFPRLYISYSPADNFNISFDYSRSINRQQFSQINPDNIYLDSLSYIIGNPFLKPEYSNYYEIGLLFRKNLTMTLGYEQITQPIIFVGMNDETNPDVTKFSYINLNKGKYYRGGLSYKLSKGKYSGAASVSVSVPNFRIPYLEGERRIRKSMTFLSITNNYKLSNTFSLFCDFRYRSPGEYGISYLKGQYNLSAGIRSNFLKNNLNISLLCNDILQKNSNGNYDEKYNNISNGMRINQDTRLIRLTVRYNFNNINSRIKKNTSHQKELNRL